MGPDAGVAAVCAVAGVVPALPLEQVPWASGSSVFTSGFEELAAYLAQVTDRTAVSRLLGISWVTVGSIVERVVARRLDGARFAKLRRIGVDEFSYRKRRRYLTIVVDHDERRVVGRGGGAARRRWGPSSSSWDLVAVRGSSW